LSVASACGASVVSAPTGKALQMNAGANAATGGILLFLHADTRLPLGYDTHVRRAIENPKTSAGAFLLEIDGPGRALRWVEKLVAFRSRVFSLPYGDQAIFVRRPVFDSLGRYPEIPIMEDFELMRRMRKKGHSIVLVPVPVYTDGRRWERLGVFRATVRNQRIILGYLLGVAPERLRQWY
ncbi:MAG: TIGR04283 family arsenosugar biosynthesis glycosyltransferase, partial [Thermodesulfobacteriota bacterium]